MKRTVSYLLFTLSLASSAMQLHAQDLAHYKCVVKALSSAKYQGRGYAKGGANKAGKFLQKEYLKAGVDEVTVQPFIIDINTFCGIVGLMSCKNQHLSYLDVCGSIGSIYRHIGNIITCLFHPTFMPVYHKPMQNIPEIWRNERLSILLQSKTIKRNKKYGKRNEILSELRHAAD